MSGPIGRRTFSESLAGPILAFLVHSLLKDSREVMETTFRFSFPLSLSIRPSYRARGEEILDDTQATALSEILGKSSVTL